MAMRAFIRTYLVVLAFAICAARADWPMAAHDPARTNSASEALTGPFTYRWTQFFDEKITRAQVIVAGGRALVGTLHGSVIAMDAATGQKLWQAKAGGPIYGSVASDGTAVFAASQDGRLYAFDLAAGKPLWQFTGAAGSICHPLVIDGMVIYADKSGALYAVAAGDGTLRWRYEANAPILASPAAWKGRVFVGSEDMAAHAVDLRSGKGLWRAQLHGMGFQETWPVCTMDIVLFTSRAYSYGGASLPIQRTIARHAPNPTEEQSIALQDAIIREIRENPALRQTLFALDIETGKEAFTPPFAYNTGRQGPPTPPCVAPVLRPRSPGQRACAPAKPAPPICGSSAFRVKRGHTSGSPISRPPGGIRSWRSSNRAGSKMRPCASLLCGRGRIRSDGGTRARAM